MASGTSERMRTRWLPGLIVGALIMGNLTACTEVEGFPTDPEDTATLEALKTKYFGPNSESLYDAAGASAKQAIRDDIVYSRMHIYDIEFSQFQRALYGNNNTLSAASDITVLVLNGIGATTGGATTKAAMNAASGGIVGARGVINKDLFYDKTLPALIAQMESNRENAKLAIFKGLKQTDAVYSLKRADLDLAILNDAGSIPNAISNITQQSINQKTAVQTQIRALTSLTYSNTDSAIKLQAWLYPNGAVNQSRYRALQAWLDKQNEPFLKGIGYPAAAFVSGEDVNHDLEPIRQRALVDPTLNIPQ